MALSKRQQFNRTAERSMIGLNKLSLKKTEILLKKAFTNLNNKKTYKFFENKHHNTYHNYIDFLYIFEMYLKKKNGKQKRYTKEMTEDGFRSFLPKPTKRQVKTINRIKKVFRKSDDEKIICYPFKFYKKTEYREVCDEEAIAYMTWEE